MPASLEGDSLQPIWFGTPEEVEAELGPGSFPIYVCGRFRYHFFLMNRADGRPRSRLAQFWFYVRTGVRLHRERPFDCIISYSHMTTGLMAACVKLLSGARLIVEVMIDPRLAYLTEYSRITPRTRLMKLYSDVCLHLSLWAADRAHLLYATQLAGYRLLRGVRTSVFHDFVLVSGVPRHADSEERYIVLVGSPWYRKGVDRLIEAFRRLAPDFPDVKLKIVGWHERAEHEQLQALAGDSTQIELVRAAPQSVVLPIISGSLLLALPSRCEGLPRVLIEGLAAGVPVVGSDAAGIPDVIRQGENGFVVPGGNVRELEERLRQLLADPELRRRMGANGYEFAHSQLSEQVYVERFTAMVADAVRGTA
jgi:glycosyltransferase involved in cell wall biosynthesis